MFVNDAIGYMMQSEQILFYSVNAFGTADAISFRDNLLRIHDLKTGISKASFAQLDVYAAFFCLEYKISPYDIDIEERLYQGNGYTINVPEPERIEYIMNKVQEFDIIIDNIKNNI